MKGRFKFLKTELDKLIKEKRKIFKNKLLPEETKETNIDLKQPIEKKEKNEKNKDLFHFLNLKYNILNNTLKKLSLLIQNEIEENKDEMNNYLKCIKDNKNTIKKDLSKEEKNIENNLEKIKSNYDSYIQNNTSINKSQNNNKENNTDENKIKLGKIINILDKSKKRDDNNFNQIKKDLKEKTNEINKEINDEKNKANFINNTLIKKYLYNINNELDKGKSYEYLKRNEYKETINSILNDILLKLGMEK
jgi:hypothetical protein